MSVSLYEYYSERAENDMFISEVSNFNKILESELLIAESSSMLNTFKAIVKKIFEFIKKVVMKIVNFFTGKKSSGGGGGGGGGSSPSVQNITKASRPEDILKNDPFYRPLVEAMGNPSELVEVASAKLENAKKITNVIKENLSKLNTAEGVSTVVNTLEKDGLLWTDADISDMQRVMGRVSKLGESRLQKARLSIDSEKYREVLCFSNAEKIRGLDPKEISKEMYLNTILLFTRVLGDNMTSTEDNPLPTTKRFVEESKNKDFKIINSFVNIIDMDNTPYKSLGGLSNGVGEKIKDKMFRDNVLSTFNKNIGKEANGDDMFIYPPTNSKAPFMFSNKISTFFLGFFPFLGVFDIEKGVFERKPIPGYGVVSKETVKGMLDMIDRTLIHLDKEKENSNKATIYYNSRKESIMFCMKGLTNMLDLMNYGDIVYGPNIEKIYMDIMANDGKIIKAANEQLVVQAINIAINKTISEVSEKVDIPKEIIREANKKTLDTAVCDKVKDVSELIMRNVHESSKGVITEMFGGKKNEGPYTEMSKILNVFKSTSPSVRKSFENVCNEKTSPLEFHNILSEPDTVASLRWYIKNSYVEKKHLDDIPALLKILDYAVAATDGVSYDDNTKVGDEYDTFKHIDVTGNSTGEITVVLSKAIKGLPKSASHCMKTLVMTKRKERRRRGRL